MKPLHERRRRSARETFSNCQFAYKSIYLDEVESGNDYTRRGSLFHLAREKYIRALWQERQASDHELAESAWHESAVMMPIPHEHRADARSLFVRWSERFELSLSTFIDAETKLRSHFGADLALDELHLDGDTLRIVDAKTFWRVPSEEELRNSYQCGNYLAAVRRLFPSFPKRVMVYDLVRFNVQISVSLSESELDEIDLQASEQDEAMARVDALPDMVPATPGDHCRMCSLACPVVDNLKFIGTRVTTLSEARRAVQVLAATHRHQEQLQAGLRAYSELHGPVESGGIEWAHRPETRYVYPAKDVQAVLDEAKVPFRLLMSGTAVKPLVNSKKKYTHVADQIRALAEARTTTKFFAKRTHDLEAEPQEVGDEA